MTEPTLVELPVTAVTLQEDRAEVERAGALPSATGPFRLRIPGITPLIVDRTLKVTLTGAGLREARVVRRWKEKPRGSLPLNASELRKRAHALEEDQLLRADAIARLTVRHELLTGARAELFRALAEGAGAGALDVETARAQLATLNAQEQIIKEALRVEQRDFQRGTSLRKQAERALATTEQPEREVEAFVELILEAANAPVHASVRYLTPCALWRPTYRATLEGSSVRLEREAVVWQRTGEEWRNVALAFSTARPTLGTSPPQLTEDALTTRPKAEQEKRVVSIAVREERIQDTGAGASSELPGLDDGGEPQRLLAPERASVPSDGQPHRVRLGELSANATVERLCVPELSPLVGLVAKFENPGPAVLLAGPVDLVRSSGFVGRSQLAFTAPQELVRLSFGSEDGLRVARTVDERTEEGRLTGKRTTTRLVHLHVSNAASSPAQLELEERLPVSEVKEVEVQLLEKQCLPAPTAVSKDGIAKLRVELKPHETRRLVFAWELTAAAKVAGL